MYDTQPATTMATLRPRTQTPSTPSTARPRKSSTKSQAPPTKLKRKRALAEDMPTSDGAISQPSPDISQEDVEPLDMSDVATRPREGNEDDSADGSRVGSDLEDEQTIVHHSAKMTAPDSGKDNGKDVAEAGDDDFGPVRQGQKSITQEITSQVPRSSFNSSMANLALENANVNFLTRCQKRQESLKPDVEPHDTGTWIIDESALHHECYNAHLFESLQQIPEIEERHNARVLGIGTVVLHVLETKGVNQTVQLRLENVKYIETSEVRHYHSIAKAALPDHQLFEQSKVAKPSPGFMGWIYDHSTGVLACVVLEFLHGEGGPKKILKLLTQVDEVDEAEPPSKKRKGWMPW